MTRSILPLLLLTCVLAACSSRRRHVDDDSYVREPGTDRVEPADPWTPASTSADDFVAQARGGIKSRRYDDARVTLHQAFRRDRWHPAANTVYQDLMIERGKFAVVWREYTDLYMANKPRGDALWFHLRPMLVKKTPLAADMANDRVLELRREIDAAQDLPAIIKKFAALAEDNPQSGDMLYLAARARARVDETAAIEMLRGGLILELPGVWLRVGMAEHALAHSKEPGDAKDRDETRSREGWEMLGTWLLIAARDADPANPGVAELDKH